MAHPFHPLFTTPSYATIPTVTEPSSTLDLHTNYSNPYDYGNPSHYYHFQQPPSPNIYPSYSTSFNPQIYELPNTISTSPSPNMCFNHGYTPPPNPNPPYSSNPQNYGYPNNTLTPPSPNPNPSHSTSYYPEIYECTNTISIISSPNPYPYTTNFQQQPPPPNHYSNPYMYTYTNYCNNEHQPQPVEPIPHPKNIQETMNAILETSQKYKNDLRESHLALKTSLQELSDSFQNLREKWQKNIVERDSTDPLKEEESDAEIRDYSFTDEET